MAGAAFKLEKICEHFAPFPVFVVIRLSCPMSNGVARPSISMVPAVLSICRSARRVSSRSGLWDLITACNLQYSVFIFKIAQSVLEPFSLDIAQDALRLNCWGPDMSSSNYNTQHWTQPKAHIKTSACRPFAVPSVIMRVCLIRPTADFAGDIQFSGGLHGFRAMAETLAAAAYDVHVLYCASKAQLLYEAMIKGCMPQLGYSQAVEGIAVSKERSITHHLGLTDVEQSTEDQLTEALAGLGTSTTNAELKLPLPVQRLMSELQYLMGNNDCNQQQSWVVLDADGSQEPINSSACSLLEACTQHVDPRKILLLVQNIHFLPLGPAGTAARTPSLLAAWGRLGGVICCSQFVAEYVWRHAGPLGLKQQQITVAHYATWHAFGRGPFEDFGGAAAQKLPYSIGASSSWGTQQQQQQQRPIIGCLKLTHEKGSQVFLALAQHLPQLNFLAVCSDPSIQRTAAGLGLPNLKLVPPEADVSRILKHVTVVLAPSVWQEAYGMAVTDAVLRGIPVVVSDQGGVAEAALGVAAAVKTVNPMVLPVDNGTGCPSWKHRTFSVEQPVEQWIHALQQVLSSKEAYTACSQACRAAGQALLKQQPELFQHFLDWLLTL